MPQAPATTVSWYQKQIPLLTMYRNASACKSWAHYTLCLSSFFQDNFSEPTLRRYFSADDAEGLDAALLWQQVP